MFKHAVSCLLILLVSFPVRAEPSSTDCQKKATMLKVGMTRSVVETILTQDGGINGVYKNERYVFADGETTSLELWNHKFCTVTIDFRPHDLAAAVYSDPDKFARWYQATGYHPNAQDIVVAVSAGDIDFYHN